MMNALKLLNYGSYELKLKDIFSHRLDSEILLSKVIGKRREELLVNLDQNIKSDEINLFKNLISRRSLREPIAYIVKEKKVEIRPLKLGEAVGNRFIVLNGVKENDLAVIKGNERLRPGQSVSIK